jgi:hypothetical protein
MTQHLPKKSQGLEQPANQNIEADDTSFQDAQLAQSNGPAILTQGNNNSFIIHGDSDFWTKEKIDLLNEIEQNLRLEFREKITEASSILSKIRLCIEGQLTGRYLKEPDHILGLIDELQSILAEEFELKSIQDDVIACEEAALWLNKNKKFIVQYALAKTFANRRPKALAVQKNDIGAIQLEKRFKHDIDSYLTWIWMNMKHGRIPKSPDKDLFQFNLDFPKEVYETTFDSIIDEWFYPDKTGLPEDALEYLISYVDEFLVERDFDMDR